MQSRLEEIRSVGEVLGLSADSAFSLGKWAEQEGYKFELLSDFGKEVIAAYGVMYPALADMKGVPKRSAFLVDRQGKLAAIEISEDASVIPDLDAFINQMKAL